MILALSFIFVVVVHDFASSELCFDFLDESCVSMCVIFNILAHKEVVFIL